jgi:bifunctional DNase/RNase
MRNEVRTKVLEIDARPSDCMVLALQARKPIFVARSVLDAVEDMTELLERITNEQQEG